jgi:hypothetical protein
MPNISIDASFNGESKTKNVFSIENAPQEVVDQLIGLVNEALAGNVQSPMDVAINVTVDGENKVAFAKSMTLAEVVGAEKALIDALDKFVGNHA